MKNMSEKKNDLDIATELFETKMQIDVLMEMLDNARIMATAMIMASGGTIRVSRELIEDADAPIIDRNYDSATNEEVFTLITEQEALLRLAEEGIYF
jgi:hypothetical protein